MYFPTDQITGIPRSRFYAAPKDYDQITDSWEYEDGTRDFNEVSSNAPRRWEYEFNLLSETQTDPPEAAAVFDVFWDAARKANPFYFTDKYGATHYPVFIEEYSRTHDAHLPKIMRIQFKLIGYNSQIVTLITPSVVLESAVVSGSDLVVSGTVTDTTGSPVELRLFINGASAFLITDTGGFTFSVPLADLVEGVNTFYVVATNKMGGQDTSNTLTKFIAIDTIAPTLNGDPSASSVDPYEIVVTFPQASDEGAFGATDAAEHFFGA